MKVNSTLIKYVKNMSGSLVAIGIKDTDIIKTIEKNNKITMCDLLNSVSFDSKTTDKKRRKKKYVKNLKKQYKKNNINYMIVNVDEVNKILKTFIRDSIYINNREIYYFSTRKTILERVEHRYHRYTKKAEITKYEDGYILKINTENAKNNYFKDKLYYIKDTLSNFADLIADILIS